VIEHRPAGDARVRARRRGDHSREAPLIAGSCARPSGRSLPKGRSLPEQSLVKLVDAALKLLDQLAEVSMGAVQLRSELIILALDSAELFL
jgi:hypothetical protein